MKKYLSASKIVRFLQFVQLCKILNLIFFEVALMLGCTGITHNGGAAWRSGGLHYRLCGRTAAVAPNRQLHAGIFVRKPLSYLVTHLFIYSYHFPITTSHPLCEARNPSSLYVFSDIIIVSVEFCECFTVSTLFSLQ